MPKLKVFLWQICHDALATRTNLLKRGLNLDPICPLCHPELESISHLFTIINKGTWNLAYQHKWIQLNIAQVGILSIFDLLTFTRTQANRNQSDCIIFLLWST